jgi:hypothetical protein
LKNQIKYLLGGVRICIELLNVVLLLIVRVNIGVDNDGCNRADTSPNVCGDCRIRLPAVNGLCG